MYLKILVKRLTESINLGLIKLKLNIITPKTSSFKCFKNRHRFYKITTKSVTYNEPFYSIFPKFTEEKTP